jgi:hypothetical protein
MALIIIDFEEKHYQLCEELSEIRLVAPISDQFHMKVEQIQKNFETWKKLGMPNGSVQINSCELE